ncbi:hypothetical protein EDB84DRAFT_1464776 [Lactarius hengduanensis]|nr:hypothetical protein EDB84DRAFT_1464776 [Lactarius hengduanensis]
MAHKTRHASRRTRHAALHLQEVLPTPPSSSPHLRLTARKPGVAAYTIRHGSPPPPPPCHSAQDPSRRRAATPSMPRHHAITTQCASPHNVTTQCRRCTRSRRNVNLTRREHCFALTAESLIDPCNQTSAYRWCLQEPGDDGPIARPLQRRAMINDVATMTATTTEHPGVRPQQRKVTNTVMTTTWRR